MYIWRSSFDGLRMRIGVAKSADSYLLNRPVIPPSNMTMKNADRA